jgi:acetyl-CoA carboxylase biotin carboxyl carrier protein
MAGAESKRTGDDVFDLERIRELIELMKQHDLSEIDLRRDKHQIRLARGGPAVQWLTSAGAMAVPPPSSAAAPPMSAAGEVAPAAAEAALKVITSPMVGTFYSRSNPNAEAYVKVGDHVSPESIVCIIEAMKVFNEIAAEISGKIVAVLVSDQDSVEFGTPLFRVDPKG